MYYGYEEHIAALCALCLLLFGGAALSETEIALSDAGVTAGAGVEVDGGDIAITQGGSYRVTGAMSEGCILVDADDVEIVWDGAQLSSSTAAPLTARGDLLLTLGEGGGVIRDLRRGRDVEADGAAIVAGGNVTVRGEGALEVSAQAGHGLRAAGLAMEGGALGVTAGGDGVHLEAEDGGALFALTGGQLTADADGRGVFAGGDAAIGGGDLRIRSAGDGLYAEGELDISGGALEISAGDGAGSASPTASYYGGFFGYDPFDFFFGGYDGYDDAPTPRGSDAVSASGIDMEGGSLVLSASGDGLRADGALTVRGGALSIACGESGLRAGGELDVLGGVLWVDECETGLTGAEVSVENAEASIVSAGEGVRADSGRGGSVRVLEGAKLAIASGGDGITAGADVELRGGEISVWCSGRSGAPLDAGGAVYTDGGTLIAAGRGDGGQVDEDSAQCALRARFNGTLRAGARVVVENGSGEAVFSFDAEEDFSRLLVTSPAIRQGETYTLYVEGEALGVATVDGAETYFRGAFTDGDDEDDERGGDDAQGAQPSRESGAERI